jgi:hypothetical protein
VTIFFADADATSRDVGVDLFDAETSELPATAPAPAAPSRAGRGPWRRLLGAAREALAEVRRALAWVLPRPSNLPATLAAYRYVGRHRPPTTLLGRRDLSTAESVARERAAREGLEDDLGDVISWVADYVRRVQASREILQPGRHHLC